MTTKNFTNCVRGMLEVLQLFAQPAGRKILRQTRKKEKKQRGWRRGETRGVREVLRLLAQPAGRRLPSKNDMKQQMKEGEAKRAEKSNDKTSLVVPESCSSFSRQFASRNKGG